jgi:hypothetical protein
MLGKTVMNSTRRDFLKAGGLGLGALGLTGSRLIAAANSGSPSFLKKASAMRIGLVTYNLAKDWEVPVIIRNCEEAKFEGVELRTTHAHGVEVHLTKDQRAEVRKQFADSKEALMGLGSAFDYHTPDQAKLRADIEATKQYIVLAHDVGATGVKVRPNGLPKEVPKEKTLEQIGRSLREVAEFAKDHGQQISSDCTVRKHRCCPTSNHYGCCRSQTSVCAGTRTQTDHLDGEGLRFQFQLVKDKIFRCICATLEEYPFRRLVTRLNEICFSGFCLAGSDKKTRFA